MRKKNRKVVADKEKTLEGEYRGIMEGRREMRIMAFPTADVVPQEEADETKAAQKNLSHRVRKQISASRQGGSWDWSRRSVCRGLSHTHRVIPGWDTPSTTLWETVNYPVVTPC